MKFPQTYACSITQPPKDRVFSSLLATIHTKEKVWEYKSGDISELPEIKKEIIIPQISEEIECYFVRTDISTGYVVWLNGNNISAHLAFGFNSNLISVDEKKRNPLLDENQESFKLWINYSHSKVEDQEINKNLKEAIDSKLQKSTNELWNQGLGKFLEA